MPGAGWFRESWDRLAASSAIDLLASSNASRASRSDASDTCKQDQGDIVCLQSSTAQAPEHRKLACHARLHASYERRNTMVLAERFYNHDHVNRHSQTQSSYIHPQRQHLLTAGADAATGSIGCNMSRCAMPGTPSTPAAALLVLNRQGTLTQAKVDRRGAHLLSTEDGRHLTASQAAPLLLLLLIKERRCTQAQAP